MPAPQQRVLASLFQALRIGKPTVSISNLTRCGRGSILSASFRTEAGRIKCDAELLNKILPIRNSSRGHPNIHERQKQ